MYQNIDLSTLEKCPDSFVLAVNDTINVLSGKWKLPIMASLLFGKKRFKELERDVSKITPRMLSKELRDLEMNGIVKRSVFNTVPVTVEYELTSSGHSFKKVLDVMLQWGLEHRKTTIGNTAEIELPYKV